MELVESRIVAVTSELNLELQVGALHGKVTHGAGCADTRPARRAIRTSGRELPNLDHGSRFLAENLFGRHGGNVEKSASGRFVSQE